MKKHPFNPSSFTVLFLAASLSVGCAKAADPTAAAPPAKAEVALAGAHGNAPAAENPSAAVSTATLTGTVLETMNAAGYTYMKLKTADGETWAAVNESKVEKGATVTIASPMPMDGFESKTLNRKFDHIVFGTLAGAPGEAAAPAAMGGATSSAMPAGTGGAPPAVPASVAAQHAAAASGPEVTEKITVAKAEGADGRTVAEVFTQRAALKGKTVAIRGKVVKFNAGIMGKNWIHLRDGSGTPAGKDNDVTVTTSDTVAKGEVVLVKGTVALDRDFGAGYTYTVIVEDGKVTK
jgi:hypothetical protein